MLLSKKQLAEALDVSTSTIGSWRTKGIPFIKQGRLVKYDFTAIVKWLIQYEVKKILKSHELGGKVLSEKEAKAREATFKAALMELKLHEERENLIRVEKVTKYVDNLISQMKASIMGVPGAWSDQIIGMKDRTEAMEKLDILSRKLLEDLANTEMNLEESEEKDE